MRNQSIRYFFSVSCHSIRSLGPVRWHVRRDGIVAWWVQRDRRATMNFRNEIEILGGLLKVAERGSAGDGRDWDKY